MVSSQLEFTAPYTPQTNGVVERKFVASHLRPWYVWDTPSIMPATCIECLIQKQDVHLHYNLGGLPWVPSHPQLPKDVCNGQQVNKAVNYVGEDVAKPRAL